MRRRARQSHRQNPWPCSSASSSRLLFSFSGCFLDAPIRTRWPASMIGSYAVAVLADVILDGEGAVRCFSTIVRRV
jgi:hypothetical protein